MMRTILNRLGLFLVRQTVATQVQNKPGESQGGKLNLKLGMRLLRDRRVPIGTKLASLALGAAAAGIFQALEIPIELLLSALFLPLGLADVAMDGVEVLGIAFGVACAVLPFIAPEKVVEQFRQDVEGRVVDAAGANVRR